MPCAARVVLEQAGREHDDVFAALHDVLGEGEADAARGLVGQHPAGNIHGRGGRVVQLDPVRARAGLVIAGRFVGGHDLVDAHAAGGRDFGHGFRRARLFGHRPAGGHQYELKQYANGQRGGQQRDRLEHRRAVERNDVPVRRGSRGRGTGRGPRLSGARAARIGCARPHLLGGGAGLRIARRLNALTGRGRTLRRIVIGSRPWLSGARAAGLNRSARLAVRARRLRSVLHDQCSSLRRKMTRSI